LGLGSAEIGNQPLQDQPEPQGQNDLAQLVGFATLGRDQDTEIKRHGQAGTEKKGQHKGDGEGKLPPDQHERKEGAGGGDITVGKVQYSGRTIYQRKAQGHQRIDAAGGKSRYQVLQKI